MTELSIDLKIKWDRCRLNSVIFPGLPCPGENYPWIYDAQNTKNKKKSSWCA